MYIPIYIHVCSNLYDLSFVVIHAYVAKNGLRVYSIVFIIFLAEKLEILIRFLLDFLARCSKM